MKKILALFLAVLFMSVLFAGCDGKQTNPGANYRILEEVLAEEFYGIGFRKGDTELRDDIELALLTMAADGTTAEISAKWFNGENLFYVEDETLLEDAADIELPERSGDFVVGFDMDGFPPMGFADEAGEFIGFDLDLAKEVCNRLGYNLVLQPVAWPSIIMELDAGNIDCIWNGFSIKADREEKVLFSAPYLKNRQVAMVLNNDVLAFSDLNGKIIAVQSNSPAYDLVEENADWAEKMQAYDGYPTAILDLKAGRVDAVVGDEVMLRYYMNK